MPKKEVIQQIAAKLQLDQTLVRRVVQCCLDSIIDIVVSDGRLELRNFGVFEVKQRAARKARNPRTNEEVFVPAKQVVTYQPGKNVVKRVQGSRSAAK